MNISPRNIRISDYNYPLPDERIAKYPIAQRDHSKLLVYNQGQVSDDVFYHLPDYLPQGALMVFNNTKVIQARLHFRKSTGALIEIFLLEPAVPADYEQIFQTRSRCSWLCLVGNLKKWKDGTLVRKLEISDEVFEIRATRKGEVGTSQLIEFQWENIAELDANHISHLSPLTSHLSSHLSPLTSHLSFADIIDAMGELPIPPYLNRDTEESDKTTYQTVYSKIKGSVAAPTAGLHFTPEVLSAVDARGIDREEVTLHVGAGTFRPVKSETIEGHDMHTEYIAVRRQTLEKLLAHDCQAIAVGTTSVRTLESLYYMGLKVLRNPDITEEQLHVSQWEPYTINERLEIRDERYDYNNAESTGIPRDSAELDANHISHLSSLTSHFALQALLDWMDRHHLTVLHSSTQIIIVPGYEYKIVKMLITNFHQPQSTLLLLVSAFVHGDWHRIYDYALQHDFRFLSYGDSSLLIP